MLLAMNITISRIPQTKQNVRCMRKISFQILEKSEPFYSSFAGGNTGFRAVIAEFF